MEGKALPAAGSPQGDGARQPGRAGSSGGGEAHPSTGERTPTLRASPGLRRRLSSTTTESLSSLGRLPPSFPPAAPGPRQGPAESRPRSTYPQKANFQLPQSHGQAGYAFNERLRRSLERS